MDRSRKIALLGPATFVALSLASVEACVSDDAIAPAPIADAATPDAPSEVGGDDGASLDAPVADSPNDSSADAADASAPRTTNVMFVTSTSHNGNLGGLVGADALCAARATAAGLSGTFVAWLSTSAIGAATRLGSARGWLRVDGMPFVDTVADLTQAKVLYPPAIDETGTRVAANSAGAWTGTQSDGTVGDVNLTCADWTDDGTDAGGPGIGHVGRASAGGGEWTGSSNASCSGSARLYCFQTDFSKALAPLPPPAGRVAFVTAGKFDTSTGLTGADTLCQGEAVLASLAGTFKAFLATSAASAVSRFDTSGTPWSRPDGVRVVAVAADLAAGQLTAPIDVGADKTS
ncbi:MAG TPA: hypothetical protein VIF62_05595, partial [Labilithrix sp.]